MKSTHLVGIAGLATGLTTMLAASGAMAQTASAVTVYGRLNTTVESQKTGSAGRSTEMVNNSSRWGLRGTEDLGDGLKAFFRMESGFDSTTGMAAATFWGRDVYLGLEGDFGRLRLGNMTNITYLTSADYVSLHNHDTGTSSDALFGFGVNFGAKANTIAYRTPSFGGLRAEISYALKETGPTGSTNATLEYSAGKLELGLGFADRGDNDLLVLRALYAFGPFTVGGYVERDDYAGARRTNLRLVGAYSFGASELHLNVGRAGNRGGIDDTGATQATLGYNYNLSRRTKVYAYYTRLANDDNATYAAFGAPAAGDSQSSLALGIRHNF